VKIKYSYVYLLVNSGLVDLIVVFLHHTIIHTQLDALN